MQHLTTISSEPSKPEPYNSDDDKKPAAKNKGAPDADVDMDLSPQPDIDDYMKSLSSPESPKKQFVSLIDSPLPGETIKAYALRVNASPGSPATRTHSKTVTVTQTENTFLSFPSDNILAPTCTDWKSNTASSFYRGKEGEPFQKLSNKEKNARGFF